MKRAITLVLILGLVFGAITTAEAAKKKKKKKPVATTLWLHGNETFGEMESFSAIADGYLPMDAKEPDGSTPKSKQLTNYLGGPNTECAGNTLFPVWVGEFAGKVTGEIKVTFTAISTPAATVDVRIWPDVNTLLCNSGATGATDYVEPAASATVALPVGQGKVEVTIPDVDFEAQAFLMLQITPVLTPPFFGRVLYDTKDVDAKIELSCVPAAGTVCA